MSTIHAHWYLNSTGNGASWDRTWPLSRSESMACCVYCLGTSVLRGDQILFRGRDLYLCAPLGQTVEGYLVIAPYRCTDCLAHLPLSSFSELLRINHLVEAFCAEASQVRSATF